MEKEKRILGLDSTIQKLKDNQKLIMGILRSNIGNGLTEKDLKTVKWGYDRKFTMLQREKQVLTQKFN